MPKSDGPLAQLDTENARIEVLSAHATFATDAGASLVLTIESRRTDAGALWFDLTVCLPGPRGDGPAELWRSRTRTLSVGLRSFCRKFPALLLPPTRLHLTGRGSGLSAPAIQKLVVRAIAQVLGRDLPPDPPSEPFPEPSAAHDWLATLRGGPEGVKRWNRLKAAERQAVTLDGADLAGLNLTGLKFRRLSARRASFGNATLARADLVESMLDGADFSAADLTGSDLKKAHAQDATFRRANLTGVVLAHGWFYGASFAGADLSGADLSEASLHKVDFTGANLTGARLERAAFNERTLWPPGFTIPAEVLWAGKGTDPRLGAPAPSASMA